MLVNIHNPQVSQGFPLITLLLATFGEKMSLYFRLDIGRYRLSKLNNEPVINQSVRFHWTRLKFSLLTFDLSPRFEKFDLFINWLIYFRNCFFFVCFIQEYSIYMMASIIKMLGCEIPTTIRKLLETIPLTKAKRPAWSGLEITTTAFIRGPCISVLTRVNLSTTGTRALHFWLVRSETQTFLQ